MAQTTSSPEQPLGPSASATHEAPAGGAADGATQAPSTKHAVTARTKARRRAVEILFEADQRGLLGRPLPGVSGSSRGAHEQGGPGEHRDHEHGHYAYEYGGSGYGERGYDDREYRDHGAHEYGDHGEDVYGQSLDRRLDEAPLEADLPGPAQRAQRLREFAAERAVHSANHTEAPAYTRQILAGVADHLEEVDETIETYSQEWTLSRMPAVDRAIARVATWEIVWNDEVDPPVAVDEAMTLARMLSTDESPRYLNGLLGRVGDLADSLR